MSRSSPRTKVAIFGLLGALGCLAGAIAGEPLFWSTESPGTASESVVITKPPKEPARLATITRMALPPPPLPPPLPSSKAELPPPPPGLGDRLKDFNAAEGYIEITLIWNDFTDLDLHCIDPNGEEIYFRNKKATRSGGELDVDKNWTKQNGELGPGGTKRPIEHIYWKDKKAPPGHYKVYVVKYADHEDGSPTKFTVDVKVGDSRWTTDEMTIGDAERQLVKEFDVKPPVPSLAMTATPKLLIDQGGANTVRVRVGRANFEGPVAINVEGELNEITAASATVPPGSGEAESSIPVSVREFAAGGPRRLNVIARGGGLEVSSPVEVEVRELPDAIRLSAPPEIAVPRLKDNTLKVVIARDHYLGAVKVRCEGDMEGLDCPAVTLKPDQTEAEINFVVSDEAALGVRRLRLVATGGGAKAAVPLSLTVEAGAPKAEAPRWSWFNIVQSAVWTALLALGLSLLLTAGQDRYLGRSPFSWRTLLASVGGLLAGATAGGGAQFLLELLTVRSVTGPWVKAVFVFGWLLLGWLLGRGMGMLIPNLKPGRAAAAGAVGGALSASVFLATSAFLSTTTLGPALSRFGGAAILGLAIGSMVALAEAIFRKNWLEVRFGEGEVRLVNLGDAPVSIGSNSKACIVWTPSAPPVALTYTLRDGRLSCTDGVTGQSSPVLPGDTRKVGSIEIVAHGSGAAEVSAADPHPGSVYQPPFPAPPSSPSPAPRSVPPPLPRPAQPYTPRPVPSLQYDDRPRSVPSPRYSPPPPVSTPAPAPVSVSMPTPPAPSLILEDRPVAAAAVPAANACPTCGRQVPGEVSARYCLICDITF